MLSNPVTEPATSTQARVAEELTGILKLDKHSRSQVTQVLSETQNEGQELKEQNRPQYQAIRENARNRIRALLSPEQLALFNQWIKDLDAKREKRDERKQTNK